ncbi:TIGR04255 family protein [Gaopeijia maritima]|uniref:TIGR04255 family protein n=1 Tax=Gaopeijia maritima TaxID=3119007 RepID=UPI003288E614
MADIRKLARAPIREAVVEIRVPRLENPNALEILETLARDLGFEQVLQGFRFSADFSFGPLGLKGDDPREVPHGFKAVSDDHIIDLDLDAVRVIRLEPYSNWEELEGLVRQTWATYREALNPEKVVRIGVRYVNMIRIYPGGEVKDSFLGLPDAPPPWPQRVSSFLFRQTLHEDDIAVNVTHAMVDDVDEDRVGIVFDIDAFTQCELDPSSDTIWGTLAALRDLKNRIFFSGLTDAVIAEYE